MSLILLDTHAWAWTYMNTKRLSPSAREAIASATGVMVSPISFYEIAFKTRLGIWPEMERASADLFGVFDEQGAVAAPLTMEICHTAARDEWAHGDPFDRIIAATAKALDVALVTKDAAFEGSGVRLVW